MAFAYKDVEYTLMRTAMGDYDLKGEPWNHISSEAIDLVTKLLDPNPNTRIGLQEALNHKWFEVVTGSSAKKASGSKKLIQQSTSEWDGQRTRSLKCDRVRSMNFDEIGMDEIGFELRQKEPVGVSPFKL